MSPLDFFLREHASVHSKEAAPADFNMDWLLDGLTDEQLRARPHGLNSMAWLLWHVARVEDSCVAVVIAGQTQLLDDAWARRLGVDHRDADGDGMTKEQVATLSDVVDLAALREYRNAVCARTRTLAAELWPERWSTTLTEDDLRIAAQAGALGGNDAPWLVGKSREELLTWWAVHHTHYHLGQAGMLRGLLVRADSGD